MAAVAAATRAAIGADRSLYLIADNDRTSSRNVGLEAATAAATAAGGHVLVPTFKSDEPGSDWNDAAKARGMDAVRLELQTGQAIGTRRKIAREIAQTRSQETERGRFQDMELTR